MEDEEEGDGSCSVEEDPAFWNEIFLGPKLESSSTAALRFIPRGTRKRIQKKAVERKENNTRKGKPTVNHKRQMAESSSIIYYSNNK